MDDFNYDRALRNMPPQHRDLLVWLKYMMEHSRDVVMSLSAQANGSKGNLQQLKDKLDALAEAYPSWPQIKWYLEQNNPQLPVEETK